MLRWISQIYVLYHQYTVDLDLIHVTSIGLATVPEAWYDQMWHRFANTIIIGRSGQLGSYPTSSEYHRLLLNPNAESSTFTALI